MTRKILLAADSHAIIIIGGTGGGSPPAGYSCSSPTADVSLTTNNASSSYGTSNERGQSWTAGVSKHIYSITIRRNDDIAVSTTLAWRIGTSDDLSSSYLAGFNCTVSTGVGEKECVVPEAQRFLSTATTVYYAIAQNTGANAFDLARDSTGGYASGTAMYDTTEDWVGTEAVSDLYFIVKMCEE